MPNVDARECSSIKGPFALFVLAFERVTIGIHFVGDKLIDIEQGSPDTPLLQLQKTLKLSINGKLRGLAFKRTFHSCTTGLKKMRERLYTCTEKRMT